MRALFSTFHPDVGVPLAQILEEKGWEIIVTANCVPHFQDHGISVKEVGDYLGVTDKFPFPPTLHPQMELALTTDSVETDRIDLVFDETYGLDQGIDVGGHTLLALALKGNRYVMWDEETANYYFEAVKKDHDLEPIRQSTSVRGWRKLSEFYSEVSTQHCKTIPLANGENPYQVPATLVEANRPPDLSISSMDCHSDSIGCFTNVADLDCDLNLLIALSKSYQQTFDNVPYIAIGSKHGNACGLGVSWSDEDEALSLALWGDPLSIWGGELVTNFAFSHRLATNAIESRERGRLFGSPWWMLDVVAAPSYSIDALTRFQKRKIRRIFSDKNLFCPQEANLENIQRSIRGGVLKQPPHDFILTLRESTLCNAVKCDLLIAWAVAFWSFHGGNEVTLVKGGQLLGVGGGPSTVVAAETSVQRGSKLERWTLAGSSFGADAFFPFTDGPELLANAGCQTGVVPGGGKNHNLVKEYFESKGVDCLFLNEDIRGFIRH